MMRTPSPGAIALTGAPTPKRVSPAAMHRLRPSRSALLRAPKSVDLAPIFPRQVPPTSEDCETASWHPSGVAQRRRTGTPPGRKPAGGVPGLLLQWQDRRQARRPLGIGLCRSRYKPNPNSAGQPRFGVLGAAVELNPHAVRTESGRPLDVVLGLDRLWEPIGHAAAVADTERWRALDGCWPGRSRPPRSHGRDGWT